jgi:uncharacterized membrane protein
VTRTSPTPSATAGGVVAIAPATRTRAAAVLAAIAVFGIAVASYLTYVKLSGGVPLCGPLAGCETVQTSEYSTVLGIPVSAFGLAYSITMLALVGGWWRSGDRRFLMGAYMIGLTGVVAVAYLVFLQLAVIHAVCAWCMAFDASVVLGFVATVIAYRRSGSASGR